MRQLPHSSARLIMLWALAASVTVTPAIAEQRIDLLGDRVAAPVGRLVQIGAATR